MLEVGIKNDEMNLEIVNITEEVVINIIDSSADECYCGICMEKHPKEKMEFADCSHNYCRNCLCKHWQFKINSGDVLSLMCVWPNCSREVTEDEVLRLCDDELAEKFTRFRTARLVQRENGVVKYCTRPMCDGWASGSRLRPKAHCRKCKYAYCWKCNQPWHGWFSRCQIQHRNVERLYNSFKRCKDIQSCPQCRAQIWKNEGCKHMTCKLCTYQYCWNCRRKWPCSRNPVGEIWCLFHELMYCYQCPCPAKLHRFLLGFFFCLLVIPMSGLALSMILLWLTLWLVVMCTFLWVFKKDLRYPTECLRLFIENNGYLCCCCR